MRAIAGAIITAAALIGLGLTAEGLGSRYATHGVRVDGSTLPESSQILLKDIDNPIKLILSTLVLVTLIGLGITFVGLSYEHHHFHVERLKTVPNHGHTPHLTV